MHRTSVHERALKLMFLCSTAVIRMTSGKKIVLLPHLRRNGKLTFRPPLGVAFPNYGHLYYDHRRIKEEIDDDAPLSAVPVPKKAGPGRRKKFVEKEKEEVIDWDALRAPTPPGLCPTPPWRREKRPPIPPVSEGDNNSEQLIPTGANPILLAASQSRQRMGLEPTSNNLKLKSNDAKGEGEGSYPTPPLQPYDLMGAHRQGQGQGPLNARWGSKMVNWDQSTPEGERVEQLHSYYARQSMQVSRLFTRSFTETVTEVMLR
jgi:hypothetical protein